MGVGGADRVQRGFAGALLRQVGQAHEQDQPVAWLLDQGSPAHAAPPAGQALPLAVRVDAAEQVSAVVGVRGDPGFSGDR